MATLSEVAKEAGVAVMSVSRVVNGSRRVTPEIEAKVRAAIRKIGYEPNEAARILKGYRARVLGLIVPDLSDPFFAICANAIQQTAREAGYMVLMAASAHNCEVERREVEIMVQRQVAGLLIIPTGPQIDHLATAKSKGIPIVAFDRPLSGLGVDELVVNNRAAAAECVKHLIDHGHRNILCVADEEKVFTKQERTRGYVQAMRRAKLTPAVCQIGPAAGVLKEKLPPLLRRRPVPTAIFAESNVVAVGVLRILRQEEIEIPQKMAFIAFDDFDAATLVSPAITVVRQPIANLGHGAASLLLGRLNGNAAEPVRVVLPTELIVRESCGCHPEALQS